MSVIMKLAKLLALFSVLVLTFYPAQAAAEARGEIFYTPEGVVALELFDVHLDFTEHIADSDFARELAVLIEQYQDEGQPLNIQDIVDFAKIRGYDATPITLDELQQKKQLKGEGKIRDWVKRAVQSFKERIFSAKKKLIKGIVIAGVGVGVIILCLAIPALPLIVFVVGAAGAIYGAYEMRAGIIELGEGVKNVIILNSPKTIHEAEHPGYVY